MKISNEIVEKHGLKIEEYESIKKLLNRQPNLLELGIFSAMWNEQWIEEGPELEEIAGKRQIKY